MDTTGIILLIAGAVLLIVGILSNREKKSTHSGEY